MYFGWLYCRSVFYAAQGFGLVEFRALFYELCVVGVGLGALEGSLCGDFEFQVADFFGEAAENIQCMFHCGCYFGI